MARADEIADFAEQTADLLEHLLALDRVRVDDRPLLVGELPGLVDDLLRDLHLADVVEECRELGLPPRLRVEAELVGDVEDERDDVLAVQPRVRVVGLDHVSEQERSAAIRVRELERVVDARRALAREVGEQAHQRQAEQEGVGLGEGRICEREAERSERQRRRATPGPAHGRALAARCPRAAKPPRGRAGEVERELGGQSERDQRQMAQRRRRGAERGEDEHRADGVPRAHADGAPARPTCNSPRMCSGSVLRKQPSRDEQRYQVERRQEEHRHEDELRRDGVGEGDLELHPRREGVAGDERDDDAEARVRP